MSNLSQYHENLICQKSKEFQSLFPESDLVVSIFDGTSWKRYEFSTHKLKSSIQESYFDLASLTKAFISTIVLDFVKYKKIKLDSPVHDIITTLKDFPYLKLFQLLNHSSHLDLITKFSHDINYSKQDLENILFNSTNVGYIRDKTKFLYSDLNYLYLGKILEKISGNSLEVLVSKLNQSFKLNVTYKPLQNNIPTKFIVPSAKTKPVGEVHDFKTFHLGGVAGNAGLFGTVTDLEIFAYNWMFNQWHFGSEIANQALYSDSILSHKPISDEETFGLTWRNGRYSNLPNHSGYTGPTMVINPKNSTALIHLNNHLYSGSDEASRQTFKIWNEQLCSLLEY